MTSVKHTARCLLLGTALAASLPVWAQYSWIDNAGRRVFSDQPPPTNIPKKDIISERATPIAAPVPTASAAAAGNQNNAQEEKKKTAADTAAKSSAEEQQLAIIQRTDNCMRARNALAGLQSGARIAQFDAQGQRAYLNDEQRAAEVQRMQSIIDSDCR